MALWSILSSVFMRVPLSYAEILLNCPLISAVSSTNGISCSQCCVNKVCGKIRITKTLPVSSSAGATDFVCAFN